MDQVSIRILESLQQRGDQTNAELAAAVGSTPSTVLRRVRELRASGHLAANVFLTDAALLGRGLKAVIMVTTKDHTYKDRMALANSIQSEPAISYAGGVTGEADAMLIGNFRDMVEYQKVCDRLFDGDPKVVRYTTHFVSEVYKDTTAVPCDGL